ncbi:MAG: anaerobic magnesium-protoporphyrin IX monomethyl ester cyclase [Myxococcota bacterium]|jgi:anaerobic magnesium-protoporphyrin IX monomethyl ester cyclase
MNHTDLTGRGRIKVLFVRPPRHYWPILNESDNFLLPLGYPSLAAYLRREVPEAECEILDCCPLKIGWQSLRRELEIRKPDIVCVGEKVCYIHEAFRLFRMVKEVLPNAVTITGGHFSSHLPHHTFERCPSVDYVLRYEGEVPLARLVDSLLGRGDLDDVPNLVYRTEGRIVETVIGPNIENLDDLPVPAYDLANLDAYAPFGLLWPRATTIQRSRGCVDTCKFCSWIAVEAKHKKMADGSVVHRPNYRSKSVERMLHETEILYEKYGVRYLFWVDATWNVDADWLAEYCDGILTRGYKLGWWAFTRLDQVLHQEKVGVFKDIVRAGLRHVLVGVERPAADSLGWLNKHGYGYGVAKEAFALMRDKYPQVFRQGTFITGIRNDTEESIKNLLTYAHEVDVDFAAFHPMTPFPGTPLYDEAVRGGWIEETDFAKYDMFCPVMPTETLSRAEVAHWTTWCQQNFVAKRPLRYFSRMFSNQPIRRRLHWWFFLTIGRVFANQAMNHMRGEQVFEGFAGVNKLWKPRWYDD